MSAWHRWPLMLPHPEDRAPDPTSPIEYCLAGPAVPSFPSALAHILVAMLPGDVGCPAPRMMADYVGTLPGGSLFIELPWVPPGWANPHHLIPATAHARSRVATMRWHSAQCPSTAEVRGSSPRRPTNSVRVQSL